MMTDEEESDVSLKEIVQQTLESKGLFAKIRAQLMASVFEVFEDSNSSTPLNPSLQRFLSSSEGRIILSLVKEFLDFFGLEATASVLATECAFEDFSDRDEIARSLDIVEDDVDAVDKDSLLQRVVERRSGSGALGSASKARLPFHISTPIQPPKGGLLVNDDSHGAGSSASPSLDLGLASSSSPNAKSRIPVPTSPTPTTNSTSKKDGFAFNEGSGIPRPKSASSVSSNNSFSSGSDPQLRSKEESKTKSKKNSPAPGDAAIDAVLNGDAAPSPSPSKSGVGLSNGSSVSLSKLSSDRKKKSEDDYLDDFNDEVDDIFDNDEDDLFGLGTKKKERQNVTSRRRNIGGSGDDKKSSLLNGDDDGVGGFLGNLPPLKDSIQSKDKDVGKLKSKHSDWLSSLGFEDEDDGKKMNGDINENVNGTANETKDESAKSASAKSAGKSSDKSAGKKSGGGVKIKSGLLSSTSEASEEIEESVDELSFDDDDDDMTTDKTFSDADAAFKKVDYTETVRAIV